MFKVISKVDYWNGLDNYPNFKAGYGLKHIQDSFILNMLKDCHGKQICEVGGGNSRVLEIFRHTNKCLNIDRMEGVGSGPQYNNNHEDIKMVNSYMGEFSKEIPDNYFDYVFSISVLEHVHTNQLNVFFEDSKRILKTGGIMIHAIDVYLPDKENLNEERRIIYQNRIREYISAAENTFPEMKWYKEPENDEKIYSSARHASNTDLRLHLWNKTNPKISDIRTISQSSSLALCLEKI